MVRGTGWWLTTLMLCGCAGSLPLAPGAAEPATEMRAAANYLTAHPALDGDGLVNVVIEIPAGTNAKWEVAKSGDALRWEIENGVPRVVQYLAYPGSYGMVPRTLLPRSEGGDGDPLDVIVLGPALERGSVAAVRPIGVLRLLDDGEQDDKIVAVASSGPLSEITSLAQLDREYPGVRRIVELWFTHYKGPGRLQTRGFAEAGEALRIVRRASEAFEARHHARR